jgi:adenylate cyclase
MEVRETIGRFAEEHSSLRLQPRIGLHDGHFYIGNTGGGGHFAYSILGDTANTAARLESLNRHLGTAILASESIISGLQEVLTRPLGCFQLVGKADSVVVHEIIGGATTASAEQVELVTRFTEAVGAFRDGNWGAATKLFEAISQRYPADGPARFYLARCIRYNAEHEAAKRSSIVVMDDK